jgi:SAM-dependent methyltransferase
MKRLNLGCGLDIRKGHVNMDILALKGIDVVHDLNKIPYPFKDNEFDVIFASHVLEHVDDLVKVMAELKRICKNGARIIIRGPHFSSGLGYRDPTHKRLFSIFTFDYFSEYSFYQLPNFKIIKRKLNFTRWAYPFLNKFFNPLVNFNQAMYERFWYWLIPCSEVIIELEVEK